jgi:hypothetical protein
VRFDADEEDLEWKVARGGGGVGLREDAGGDFGDELCAAHEEHQVRSKSSGTRNRGERRQRKEKEGQSQAKERKPYHAKRRLIHLLGPLWEILPQLRHRRAQPGRILRRAVDGYIQDLA